MSNIIRTKIIFNCDAINKGKLSSCEAVQTRYVKEIAGIVQENGLKTYFEDLAEGWKTIWIYKDDYMLDVIKELPDEPKTIFEHWLLGKAFGYSDESIKTFIQNTCTC